MKTRANRQEGRSRAGERGSSRPIILGAVFFLLGALASALWLRPAGSRTTTAAPGLSNSTKAILDRLPAPVEVRFYSLLDPSAGSQLKAFSQRLGQLLAAYQEQAPGKITLVRYEAGTTVNPNSAAADGIRGFDLDKGDGCYLGVALSSNGRKEVLAQLQPDWEAALEPDLSRALERLAQGSSSKPGSANPAPLNPVIVEQVKQTIPGLPATSVQEGTRMLRAASLSEFAAAVTEMQAQVAAAEARLIQAQKSGTAAEQEAAMKKLQELQAAQSQKLKDIAARSQAMVDALNQIKSGSK